MDFNKQTYLTAFALFSLFFGAGNLILPPFLGYNAGEDWFWVLLGFGISAVVIPIMAIYGYARIQGTMLDFAKKISPAVALVYCVIVYAISVALPAPRTASVTYEMAVQPYSELSSLWLSTIYFAIVLVFVLNRTKIISLIGKFLTPFIIILLLCIIGIGLFGDAEAMKASIFDNGLSAGILEGYQTFDAIGGVVVGGVIVISLALQGKYNYEEKKKMIAKSGLLAGIGLFAIYGGLIALGAYYSATLQVENRTELLQLLSTSTLGKIGTAFLGILVALACFTTAVGIITGTSDFVKGLCKNSQTAYIITAVLGCVLGVAIGQFDVHYIIDIALPALMFIYPITIVLIILNTLPERFASTTVFRAVALVTFLFSIPDFLGFFIAEDSVNALKEYIPLSKYSMGWVLPALFVFVLVNLFELFRGRNTGEITAK
ncbi:branched-chain amino acid transport system II carrier protein [Rasiella sp. SM2506]|uniref:branched-chain amino acid transport system II carrier protein n=1 Tax=Rasiella sp. SM2506 TaxID=3423914 RepID=UPI003D78DF56